MSRRKTIELEAHTRALKKQGARLAAERDNAYDRLEFLDQAMSIIQDQQQQIDDLEQTLAQSRDSRHRLLMKIKEMKDATAPRPRP
jgi:predicted RNase H-like nuclease (RuvC/YqgF family)